MPKFSYKAKEGPGKIINGLIEADSQDAAINKILQLRLTPIDVFLDQQQPIKKTSIPSGFKFEFSKRIRTRDLVVFTRQMSDLVDAAVPILRALQIVQTQTSNPQLKQIVSQMSSAVKDGASFSESLSKHPKVFSNLYVSMVRSGEVAGQLEKVLKRLADYEQQQEETMNKVKASLAYPALILGVGILTVFVLLTFVIPRLTVMFDDLNQTLPLPTVILVSLSSFLSHFGWMIVLMAVFVVIAFKRWLESEQGRVRFDKFKLNLFLLGNFIKIVEVSRFCRTLGTLLESGVTITAALRSVSGIADNILFKEEIKKITDLVTNGASLKTALKGSQFFPDMAVNMISVAEESGRLERGLYKVADTYEQEADQNIKTIVSLLGPMVLVVIVGIVGFVVMAMLLPIFKMNMVIQ